MIAIQLSKKLCKIEKILTIDLKATKSTDFKFANVYKSASGFIFCLDNQKPDADNAEETIDELIEYATKRQLNRCTAEVVEHAVSQLNSLK